jgi:hypothetical protein
MTDVPNFLASTAWDAHQESLARLTIIPMETWRGLQNAYHNAKQLRSRIAVDGPKVPFPKHRLPTLGEHKASAEELSAILYDAAEKIAQVLGPLGEKRGLLSRLRTERGRSGQLTE